MSVRFKINFRAASRVKLNDSGRANGLSLQGTNGCLVILIHGLTGTPNEMRFLANFLNKKGYSVISPRLANHGQPLGVLKNTHWQEFYGSVQNAFREVKDGYKFIFASGLSMGAILALLLAQEFPEKISGVSCLSPTLFYDGWNVPWYRCFLPLVCATPLRHWFYFKEDPPYGIKNEQIRQRIHKYYSQAGLANIEGIDQFGYPYFPVNLFKELHLLVKYMESRLKDISVPVQLIQAREDDMTSIKNSQFIYDRIKSQKKEIVLIDNCYHVITADQGRDTVAQKMDEFFSSISKI